MSLYVLVNPRLACLIPQVTSSSKYVYCAVYTIYAHILLFTAMPHVRICKDVRVKGIRQLFIASLCNRTTEESTSSWPPSDVFCNNAVLPGKTAQVQMPNDKRFSFRTQDSGHCGSDFAGNFDC